MGGGRRKRTLCHRECNKAQIMSSRKTRCHDTSSPVEDSRESNTAVQKDKQKKKKPLNN